MKVFLSLDMEGVSGIVSRQETLPEGRYYEAGRNNYTGDVNAAVEGALAGGATEVAAVDPHHELNLFWSDLHPKLELVRRDLPSHSPLFTLEGLDSSFDVVFFIGAHSRYGHARGVLSHTITRPFSHVWINGELVNEVKISTGMAGLMGVPVGLVTGDDAICEETARWLPRVETAAVKMAIDTYTAICLPLDRAQARIRMAAERATRKVAQLLPFTYAPPVDLQVGLLSPSAAARLSLLPGVERKGDQMVAYRSEDYRLVWRMLWAMVHIASQTRDPIPW